MESEPDLIDQQCCGARLHKLTTGTLEMTEYVIREVSPRQWLVFADRQCIASCADEAGAEKAMMDHSALGRRPSEPTVMAPDPADSARNARGAGRLGVSDPLCPKLNPAVP